MSKKYLLIEKSILSSSFEKVIIAKELLKTGKAKEVTEAVKLVGISRSTFYKYKDKVFAYADKNVGKKIIFSFMLNHTQGVLAKVIQTLSDNGGNILTINQEIPINNVAGVNITFEYKEKSKKLENIIDEMKKIDGVNKVYILAME